MHLSVFQFAIILVHKHSSPGFILKPDSKFLNRNFIFRSVRHTDYISNIRNPFKDKCYLLTKRQQKSEMCILTQDLYGS